MLKSLITKREIFSIVSGLNGEFEIVDTNGTRILGNCLARDRQRFPVTFEGEEIGAVYGDEQAEAVANLLGYVAGTELKRKKLTMEVIDKRREMELLHETTALISASLSVRDAARLTIERATAMIPASGASVMLFHEEANALQIVAAFGHDHQRKVVFRPGFGVAGHVFASGEAAIIGDVTRDARFVPSEQEIASMICVPLKAKDKTIGVIVISSAKPYPYQEDELRILTIIAAQAAVAIENARLYELLQQTFFDIMNTLAETIEMRDPQTGGHTRRVLSYCQAIGQEMGLTVKELGDLRIAASLHDIGMIGISDRILLKHDKLDPAEFNEIKKHAEYGDTMLKHIKELYHIVPAVRAHHERFDGKGYPDGLAGRDIPLLARIISVADTYDAMTSDRIYRKGMDPALAIQRLQESSGSQLDPQAVKAFLRARLAPASRS